MKRNLVNDVIVNPIERDIFDGAIVSVYSKGVVRHFLRVDYIGDSLDLRFLHMRFPLSRDYSIPHSLAAATAKDFNDRVIFETVSDAKSKYQIDVVKSAGYDRFTETRVSIKQDTNGGNLEAGIEHGDDIYHIRKTITSLEIIRATNFVEAERILVRYNESGLPSRFITYNRKNATRWLMV